MGDVPVLLEAQQEEAHVAPAEADALAELARGEARLVLERPGDQAEAVEDLDRHRARERLRMGGPPASRRTEELRP